MRKPHFKKQHKLLLRNVCEKLHHMSYVLLASLCFVWSWTNLWQSIVFVRNDLDVPYYSLRIIPINDIHGDFDFTPCGSEDHNPHWRLNQLTMPMWQEAIHPDYLRPVYIFYNYSDNIFHKCHSFLQSPFSSSSPHFKTWIIHAVSPSKIRSTDNSLEEVRRMDDVPNCNPECIMRRIALSLNEHSCC